jgi:uncharacterized damage-inducible protein DinB
MSGSIDSGGRRRLSPCGLISRGPSARQKPLNSPPSGKDHLNTLQEADLEGSVTYKNTKGEPWTSRADDILMHVIMHSAYHRGQIASDMRAAGFTPASTDFILAIRQGFVE